MHEAELGKVGKPLGAHLWAPGEPAQQLLASFVRAVIHAARRPLGGRLQAARQPAALLQLLQSRIDLAQFGGPEMARARTEVTFDVIPAGWCAEHAQQDVIETHFAIPPTTSISIFI